MCVRVCVCVCVRVCVRVIVREEISLKKRVEVSRKGAWLYPYIKDNNYCVVSKAK